MQNLEVGHQRERTPSHWQGSRGPLTRQALKMDLKGRGTQSKWLRKEFTLSPGWRSEDYERPRERCFVPTVGVLFLGL